MIRKAAAIIIENSRLLIVKCNRGETFISPGGKYEGNESSFECLSRELAEELNIKLKSATYFRTYQEKLIYGDGSVLLETYFVRYEGTPRPSSEITEIHWASPEEITNGVIDAASGIKRLVPDLIKEGRL